MGDIWKDGLVKFVNEVVIPSMEKTSTFKAEIKGVNESAIVGLNDLKIGGGAYYFGDPVANISVGHDFPDIRTVRFHGEVLYKVTVHKKDRREF